MLTKDVARKLNYLVNDKTVYDGIKAYAELRMEELKERMANLSDPSGLKDLQGQYREAKRLLTLREEVDAAKKT